MYRTLMKNTKFISHILREIDEILSWNKKKIFSFLLFKLSCFVHNQNVEEKYLLT